MRKILVTGGAGFIGSNFVKTLLEKEWGEVYNLDALTYAGNLENLVELKEHPHYTFIKGNICDKELIEKLFRDYDFDWVVNLAAESHVDRSIQEPEIFLQTNIMGTQVLLEAAKRHWKVVPEDKYSREYKNGVKFLQISTDEVYGSLGQTGYFTEESPLCPSSPYSASKAAADLMVKAYYETFGLPVNITRCANNYGPYQFPEKLIPLMINNCRQEKKLPVYGDGLQIRDWLHVSDHCRAILLVLEKGKIGETYNIGGNNEKTNLQIVHYILDKLGKSKDLIEHLPNRPGGDFRYAIDNRKITMGLGWQPQYNFEEGMEETINWYLQHSSWLEKVVSGEYQEYYRKMYPQQNF